MCVCVFSHKQTSVLSGQLQVASVQLVLVKSRRAAHSEARGHDQILQQETRQVNDRQVGE